MVFEILITIFSGLIAALGGWGLNRMNGKYQVRKIIRQIADTGIVEPRLSAQSYSGRLTELITHLSDTSKEVDITLREISQIAINRTKSIENVEKDLNELESKEIKLKERIQALEQTPVPVADYFAELMDVGERRSAQRDYMLFGAGVLVSTVIAILLQLVL